MANFVPWGGGGFSAFTGSGSGGAVAHADTTGQTTDDHHAQAHAFAGADHTASTLAAVNTKISDATLVDGVLAIRNSQTGIKRLIAGVLTINGGDNTLVDIAAGTGQIVDNTTDPGDPTLVDVTWGASVGVTVTNLGTTPSTTFYIDSGGSIVQMNTPSDGVDRRTLVLLGVAVHVGMTVVESVADLGVVAGSDSAAIGDVLDVLGDLNIDGNIYGPNGVNLLLDKTVGNVFGANLGPAADPNFKATVLQSGISSYVYTYQPAVPGNPFNTVLEVDIDPNFFDDGSGTLAAMTNNRWQIQRLLFEPRTGLTAIEYGQAEYMSQADAIDAISANGVIKNPALTGLTLRGWLIVQEGATDLSSAAQAAFRENTGEVAQASGFGVDPNAVHVNVSGEIAAIVAKSPLVLADKLILEDSEDSNSKALGLVSDIINLSLLGEKFITPTEFVSTNNADWAVNALAPAEVYAADESFRVIKFDDTVERGIGFLLRVPTGAVRIQVIVSAGIESAPGVADTADLNWYEKENAPTGIGTWSTAFSLTQIVISTDTNFRETLTDVPLASLGLDAGQTHMIQVTRAPTTTIGDLNLLFTRIQFTA